MIAAGPARIAQTVALAAHVALVAGLLLRGLLGVLAALPLLAALPGLWRGRTYTAGWGSLLLTFYAGFLLAELYGGSAHRGLSLALAAFAAIDFCALMLFIRFTAAARRAR